MDRKVFFIEFEVLKIRTVVCWLCLVVWFFFIHVYITKKNKIKIAIGIFIIQGVESGSRKPGLHQPCHQHLL